MDDKERRDAYVAGLKLLAGRELSEQQLRQRLSRQGHAPPAIDAAVERLRTERAVDDARMALTLARHEINTKRHGRLRAQRQLEAAGLPPGLARSALDDVLEGVDQDALLQASLARRLRGTASISDDGEFRRLYRFLIGQGFESDRVMRALHARRR